MVATCAAPEEIAVARCTEPLGAISGSSAAVAGLSKAPAIPITKVAMNICATVSQPAKVETARNSAVAASAIWQSCTTRLRSNRSAAWPATKTSSAVGRNCTSPTMPRWKALPVMS